LIDIWKWQIPLWIKLFCWNRWEATNIHLDVVYGFMIAP
jgi:hypothetical protein